MKKGPIKEWVVFGILTFVSALLLWCTTLIGSKKTYPYGDEDCLRLLFLGDSNYVYEMNGTTIPQRIGEQLNAEVYNCAVGGTTAAKLDTANYIDTKMDLFCLSNMVKIMECGDVQGVRDFAGSFDEYGYHGFLKATILADIDFKKMDYVVLSYGINDYTTGRPVWGENPYDWNTYAGALRNAIESIKKTCPNAKIIIASITYCTLISEDGYPDGYQTSYGGGTIEEYRDAAMLVASEYESVFFLDNLKELPITYQNFSDYLCDGLHLNEQGQIAYTEHFVSMLEEIERN